jgi:3-methyladenine DNA glycosylase Mpg
MYAYASEEFLLHIYMYIYLHTYIMYVYTCEGFPLSPLMRSSAPLGKFIENCEALKKARGDRLVRIAGALTSPLLQGLVKVFPH